MANRNKILFIKLLAFGTRMKFFILLLLYVCPVYAVSYVKIPYQGVYDGDTIYSEVNLPSPLNEVSVRIFGIDTPEKGARAQCDQERMLSEKATQFLESLLEGQKYLYLSHASWDKYGGRILAKVYYKSKTSYVEIAPLMLNNQLAVEYYGEKKDKDWCK